MIIWQNVTQEFMSDEEDHGEVLKVKSPDWRTNEVSELIKMLDKREMEKDAAEGKVILKRKRVVGQSPNKRRPSNKIKKDMIRITESSESEYESEDESGI